MRKKVVKLHCINCGYDWDEEEKAGIYIVCLKCGRPAPRLRKKEKK